MKDTQYFKITSIKSKDQYCLYLVETSKDLLTWKLIFKSEIDSHRTVGDWIVSYIKVNRLENNYQIISDFDISFRINNSIYEYLNSSN